MPHDSCHDAPAPGDRRAGPSRPGLTACSLCAGETLGGDEAARTAQLARLRRIAADGVARVTFVECLDECERGDVVVARPGAGLRAAGVGPVWFERLAGDGPTERLRGWLAAGGPGTQDVPAQLAHLVITRDEA